MKIAADIPVEGQQTESTIDAEKFDFWFELAYTHTCVNAAACSHASVRRQKERQSKLRATELKSSLTPGKMEGALRFATQRKETS